MNLPEGYHKQPPKSMERVTELWLFLGTDEDDQNEGVLADPSTGMPLIAFDEARLESIRPIADMIARTFGTTIRVAHFSARVDEPEVLNA